MTGAAHSVPDGRPRRRLALLVAVLAIATLVTAIVLAYLAFPPTPREARILSVTVSPDLPGPVDAVRVAAEVEGGSTRWRPDIKLQYHAYFNESGRGGGPMAFAGGNLYTRDIGPFQDGTEVWLVVAAYDGEVGLDVSADRVVQIGRVLRGGPSDLTIENVSHTPLQPRRGDTIEVTAGVTTNSTVTRVTLIFAYAYSPGFGVANGTMVAEPSGTFSATIENPFLFGYVFEPGTLFLYRVAAVDATGNTALTGVLTFRVM